MPMTIRPYSAIILLVCKRLTPSVMYDVRKRLFYLIIRWWACAAGERDTTPQAGVPQRCCISESTDGRIPLHAAWKLAKGKYMHLTLQQCHIPVIPAHVSARRD